MAHKQENDKKTKWIYKASALKKKLKSHSTTYWVKQCLNYLDEMEDKGKCPSLAGMFKFCGMWVYYLRDELAKGKCQDSDLLERYDLIKRIVSQGTKERVIDLNIGTATFGIAMLQNEDEWDKRDKVVDVGAMSITFVNYALPDAVAPALPTTDPTIIDAEVVEPIDVTIDYDTLPTITEEQDVSVPIKDVDDDNSSWDMFDD
jgi:hypothetical protein